MTFSIAARCPRTGMLGVAITTSSIAVASRCPWARAGVGAVATQNITDPSLGRKGLDLLQAGKPAPEALRELMQAAAYADYRQVTMIDAAGQAASERRTAGFVSVQNELSLLEHRHLHDLLDACERNGVAIVPYLPLAAGMLTGKYVRDAEPPAGTRLAGVPADRRDRVLSDHNFDVVERLTTFAAERGRTLVELAMSWLAGLPSMGSIIAGATTPAQVHVNATSTGWRLSDAERAEVDRITAL